MFKTKTEKKTNADLRRFIISGINDAELDEKVPGTFKGMAILIRRRFEKDCWPECKAAAARGQSQSAIFAKWLKGEPSLFVPGFADSLPEAAERLLDSPSWHTEADKVSRLLTLIYNEIQRGVQS